MPKIRKVVISLITSIYLLVSLMLVPTQALADEPPPTTPSKQSTWYNQGFNEWYSKVYGEQSAPSEIFGERYTAAQVQWIIYGLFAFPINLLGGAVQDITACVIGSPGVSLSELSCYAKSITIIDELKTGLGISTGLGSNKDNERFGLLQVISTDYQNRELSGIKYTINTISKYTTIPTVNAQGFGYGAVKGLQDYWQGFRDVAYALTVLIVIIFSFMIMFRVKLSPQLVISVQSALPKVFTALILATFSYAIAGFMIDLSYVAGGLFASLMSVAKLQDFQTAFNIIVPVNSAATGMGAFYILFFMAYYMIYFFIAAILSIGTAILAPGGIGSSIAGVIMGILAMLTTIWILLLLLWYTVKIPIVLLKNLVSLIISIVVAPIQIVMGAIVPSIGFSVWIKKIIAEALVFPVTGLFMFLALKTVSISTDISMSLGPIGTNIPTLWSPPILGSADKISSLIWLAVSFSFITIIPKVVDILKMLIMGTKFDFGSAMGEATGLLQNTGYGLANKASGKEAADWANIQRNLTAGQKPRPSETSRHNFWNFVRGSSSNKIK